MDNRRILALRQLPFPWDGTTIIVCADQREVARTHPEVLYAGGTAVVIIRGSEPN